MSNEQFTIHVSDELFDFVTLSFDDNKITGAEIAEAFGARPAIEYRIYVQLENCDIENLRVNEKVDIKKEKRFFVVKGDADYSFIVDGVNLLWPKPLNGLSIKKLIKATPDKQIFLEKKDVADALISDTDIVDIQDAGLEKLYTKKVADKNINIIVEGALHIWHKDTISYEEVVTLEVPDYASHPEVTYSVKYKKGVGEKPEGILSKGAYVKVKDGMVFNVSETGQS
ncbi:multiubiquitin domain-containing protein [Pantoea agglomerans]|nr:multiubiquitin domain-containing protein [Pantoea agglomerans]WIL43065.1 multiubiquitin domain-containing protein [Pantoea agglomerans]